MIINKYYVFVPQEMDIELHTENEIHSDTETQRQALLKQAQDGAL